MKDDLKRLLPKIQTIDVSGELSEKDDHVLCVLEQLIGGSMVEAIGYKEKTIAAFVDTIVDGDDEYEPIEEPVIIELIETLERY